uniref:Uncharacterized protein n=1 Tax=Chrysemys picta bellii TaxID=8478 RepID=A0A8C3FJ81_CHRPI
MRLAWSGPDGPGAGGQETQGGGISIFLRINKDRSVVVLYSELQQGLSSGTRTLFN